MKKFGFIKKEDVYICGSLVGQTYRIPNSEKEIYCIGKNNSKFVYDLDNLVLIKCGEYYINLECITSYMQFEKIKHSDRYNHTYIKNKALSKKSLQRIVDKNDPAFDGKLFVVKDNLLKYNDQFAFDYNIDTSVNSEFISFKQLKKLHDRCVLRRDEIDNLKVSTPKSR